MNQRNIINKISNNKFFKNIMLLASGSVLAQVIAVICAPIITRLFSVDDIGVYSYLIAMISTFTAIMNGRYDMAIVSEKDEKNIYPLIKLSFIIGLCVSVLATIGFGIYFWLCKPEYKQYRYMIIFFLLILIANSLINIFNSYNNRKQEYKVMTLVYVIRTGCQNLGAVFLGLFHTGVMGLILPYTIGQYLGMKRQSKTLSKSFKEIWKSDYKKIKEVAKEHIQLPLYSVPAMFANSFSYSSVTIFMESLFDMATVGYYSLSTRILGLPLSLVSGNVSKVFFQEASEEYIKKGEFKNSFKKTLIFLTMMAIPMGAVMYLLAPWACKIFFGESWIIAGTFIRILTPYYMLRFIGTALSPGMLVCNKQKQELFIQFLLVITSIISFGITYFTTKTVETFLWSICGTKSIIYAILIVLVWHNASENK